jgi:hypothetical protein
MTDGALYTGLSGLELDGDNFDLGEGITLKKTYAHLMMPHVVAFKRAEPGKAHPAPWKPAESGIGFDIEAELYVPAGLKEGAPWEISRAIVFLLRIGINPGTAAPLLAGCSFAEMPETKQRLMPLETRRRYFGLKAEDAGLNKVRATWVRERWQVTQKLIATSAAFELAVAAMDAGQFERNTALTLVSLWGAMEAIFSGERSEVTFRLSSYMASYLSPVGSERGLLQKRIAKLYGKRSAAAHGLPNHQNEDLLDTFTLLRNVLMRIIEQGVMPTRENLDALLFAGKEVIEKPPFIT